MIWESACWGTALGRLVTCPAHLDQPPVRDRRQLPHLITASPAHGAGNRKQSWPHWLSDPISEITTPSPLLFTNEETEDTTLSQGLAQVLPLSHSPQHTPATVANFHLATEASRASQSLFCLRSQPQPGRVGFSPHLWLASLDHHCNQAIQLVILKLTSDHVTLLPWHQVFAQSRGPQMTHNQVPSAPCSLISSHSPRLTSHIPQMMPELPPSSLLYLCGFAQAVVSSWNGISSAFVSLTSIHPSRQHCHLQEAFPDAPQ